jgi:hypothetical protein
MPTFAEARVGRPGKLMETKKTAKAVFFVLGSNYKALAP